MALRVTCVHRGWHVCTGAKLCGCASARALPTLKPGSLSSQGLRPPHGCLIMLSGGSNSRLNNPKLFDMLCGEMVGMVGDGGDGGDVGDVEVWWGMGG